MTALDGTRILVVEDHVQIAMAVCDVLEDHGCTVVGPVGRAEDAERLAQTEEIDIALLDVDLHGQPSFPIARTLRRRGVPVVLLTGFNGADLPPDLAGVTLLEKPVPLAEIVSAVAGVVGDRASSA